MLIWNWKRFSLSLSPQTCKWQRQFVKFNVNPIRNSKIDNYLGVIMIEYCRYTPVVCAIISSVIACWNIARRADTFRYFFLVCFWAFMWPSSDRSCFTLTYGCFSKVRTGWSDRSFWKWNFSLFSKFLLTSLTAMHTI